MTNPPKRRGRPPGSKNKLTPEPIRALPRTATGFNPSIVAYPTEYVELSASGTNVRLKKQQAMGDDIASIETTWPAGWPLPVLGQVILSAKMSGKVRWVEFDLDFQTINITLE